jgi:hypothetical protein
MKTDLRNWRPDVLAFTELPVKTFALVDLARAISGGRGMVTLASIVPEAAGSLKRMGELSEIMRAAAAKRRLSAFVRVYASDDPFREMRTLVHAYGFGPFVPDTVLVGVSGTSPHLGSVSRFAAYLAGLGRNAVFVRERQDSSETAETEKKGAIPRIDVWWRGKNQNGAFMLALASLVVRSAAGKARVRLCNIAEKGVKAADAERILKNFLLSSRVDADIFVRDYEPGVSPLSVINAVSADAQYAFIGLRPPAADESEESYAEYFRGIREETQSLRSAVFSLAADGVDFRGIYRE